MMRMSNKKISALLMALTLVVLMIFSGCSTGDNAATENTKSSTAATTEKTTVEETREETASQESKTEASTDDKEETPSQSLQSSETAENNDGGSNTEKPAERPAATEAPTTQQSTQPPTEKPTEAATEPQVKTCTININCSTILSNMDKLKEEKKEIVPASGVILSGCEMEIQEGDSVYDVLVRACQQNKIHMDANYTPAYGSAYIKGIANLYERDCGRDSGWVYRVNGAFPNVGCSSYEVKEGDVIEFLYTCNLGADVGNSYNG